MRELSLFSGAGGGVYASKLLGWKTLGYVEWEDYCQKVIAQRIKDGIFDQAPIFGDVRTFVSEGYAKQYKSMVDIVTGGFPCQPFSVAGKRKASDDERNMWPATLDVIKSVSPSFVFLENVPGLLSATVDDESGRPIHYFGTILRDLAESGYSVRWCVLGADDVGAPHHRKRLWVFGWHTNSLNESKKRSIQKRQNSKPSRNCNAPYSNSATDGKQYIDATKWNDIHAASKKLDSNPKHNGSPTAEKPRRNTKAVCNIKKRPNCTSEFERVDSSRNVANTPRQRCGKARHGFKRSEKWLTWSSFMAYPKRVRLQRPKSKRIKYSICKRFSNKGNQKLLPDTNRSGQSRPREYVGQEYSTSDQTWETDWLINQSQGKQRWWNSEPSMGRVANGVADRSNRLKATGNGQVSLVAAVAFKILSRGLI